jgi:hypothetical protein
MIARSSIVLGLALLTGCTVNNYYGTPSSHVATIAPTFAAATPEASEKYQAALAYAQSVDMAGMMRQLLLKTTSVFPNLGMEARRRRIDEVVARIDFPAFGLWVATLMVDHLTYEEVKDTADFFRSPVGRSLTGKWPLVYAKFEAEGIDVNTPISAADAGAAEQIFRSELSAQEYAAMLNHATSPLGKSVMTKFTQVLSDPKVKDHMTKLVQDAIKT